MEDEKKTVGRDASEPKRSGRQCKTSELGGRSQRTENPSGFRRGECQMHISKSTESATIRSYVRINHRLKNFIKFLTVFIVILIFLHVMAAVYISFLTNKMNDALAENKELTNINSEMQKSHDELEKQWIESKEIYSTFIQSLESEIQQYRTEIDNLQRMIAEDTEEPEITETVELTPTKLTSTSTSISAKDSGFRCFEYSNAITNTTSKQWKIVHEAYVGDYGFLYHTGFPLAAIGHGWGYVIGDIVEVITTENRYTIVVGDYKAYKDTDSTNKISYRSGCMCEFIVDKGSLDIRIKKSGNVATLDQYKGYVTDMIKLGNVWED